MQKKKKAKVLDTILEIPPRPPLGSPPPRPKPLAPQKENNDQKMALTLEPLTWSNHESVIHQLCEYSQCLGEEEKEREYIEWARARYLDKVKHEYGHDMDAATKLNRVVWTGKFREVAREYFKTAKLLKEAEQAKQNRGCGLCCC
jgi:primase-polymerase (primpol)-like protein